MAELYISVLKKTVLCSPLGHSHANPGEGLFPVRAHVSLTHQLLSVHHMGLWRAANKRIFKCTKVICCWFYFLLFAYCFVFASCLFTDLSKTGKTLP